MSEVNPRVLAFLRAHALPEDTFPRKTERAEYSPLYLEVDGARLPFTIAYSQWVMAQWRAWAAELGFVNARTGEGKPEIALLAGRTHEDFDAWLNGRFPAAP